MSTGDFPKRHHFVPETYLRAWCDADGRVPVRRRDQDKTFLTNPVNVGVETRLYGDGIEGLWREKNFKLVEDEWPRLRNDLVQRGHLHGNDRDLASTFMALQIARTRERIAHNTFRERESVPLFRLRTAEPSKPSRTRFTSAFTSSQLTHLTSDPQPIVKGAGDQWQMSQDLAVVQAGRTIVPDPILLLQGLTDASIRQLSIPARRRH